MKTALLFNDIKGEAHVLEFDDPEQAKRLQQLITSATRGSSIMVKLGDEYISPGSTSQVTVSQVMELDPDDDPYDQWVTFQTEHAKATNSAALPQIHGFGPIAPQPEVAPVAEKTNPENS